jgi:hypothetical protein
MRRYWEDQVGFYGHQLSHALGDAGAAVARPAVPTPAAAHGPAENDVAVLTGNFGLPLGLDFFDLMTDEDPGVEHLLPDQLIPGLPLAWDTSRPYLPRP